MKPDLRGLLSKHHLVWQGNTADGKGSGVSTGFAELDQALPTRGWPEAALTEIAVPYWGLGELRLLLPAMVHLNRQKRRIVWIAPPYLPYAPALARAGLDLQYVMVVDTQSGNVSWAMERLSSTRSCGMVLAWPTRLSEVEARRLQLAAETGGGIGIVLRAEDTRWRASSAALRLKIEPLDGEIAINILKSRGGSHRSQVAVSL
jgi:hypothetical protein